MNDNDPEKPQESSEPQYDQNLSTPPEMGSSPPGLEQGEYEYNTPPTDPQTEFERAGIGTSPMGLQGEPIQEPVQEEPMVQEPEAIPREGPMEDDTLNIDVLEQDDELVIIADLPGIDEDEIDIRFTVDGLQIKGTSDTDEEETKDEGTESSPTYIVRERPQSWSRTVYLPDTVERDESSVDSVEFKNGRLTITLRKTAVDKQVSI